MDVEMPSSVVVVEDELPPAGRVRRWRPLPATEFRTGAVRRHTPAVVVLRERAIDALDPAAVRRAVRGAVVRLLVVPEPRDVGRNAFWARALPHAEFVPEGRWIDRAVELQGARLREPVPRESWSAPAGSAEAERLLDALERLDRPRVGAWAASVSMSPRGLLRACRRHFRCASREMCRTFAGAHVDRARSAGISLPEIAESLGYADAPTLLRVLRVNRSVRDRSAGS